jgi:hypothetical protein
MNSTGIVKRISMIVLLTLVMIGLVGGVWLWDIPAAHAEEYEGGEGGETPPDATGVVLDLPSANMLVGDTLLLTVTVTPDDAVCPELTWNSNNMDVATVDDEGQVSAVAEGTAEISFTAGAFTGVCEITVRPAYTVSLDQDAVTLAQSDTLTLTPAVDGSDGSETLTWTSSATGVASVEAGVVTAHSPGEATITVSAGDGVSDTCAVTVVPSQIIAPCYQVDRSCGHLLGVRVKTTVGELIANLENDADMIRVYDKGQECVSGLVKTGMTVSLMVGGEEIDHLTVKALGDVDGDGYMGVYEYTCARIKLLGAGALSDADASLLDMNGDNRLSISDYIMIRLEILGLSAVWDGQDAFPDIQPSFSGLSSAGCSAAVVTWNAVENAAGYELYRSSSESGEYTLIASLDRSVLSYTDTGLEDGRACYYKVLAYRAAGSIRLDTQYSTAGRVNVPAFTVYYQGDSRWGFSSSVRKTGCVITAYAITVNNMGIPCTPPDIYKSNGNGTPMNMTNLRKNFGVKAVCALPAGSQYLSGFDGHKTYIKNASANAEAAIKEALKLHPEGVILYFKKGSDAHAIVACKVSGGEILFSDPGRNRTTLVNFANTWCKVGHNMSYKHLVEMIALDKA